jgi:NAD(P)-dependent dehydrogenase (short-subunit alcohol dehydrogenase family)
MAPDAVAVECDVTSETARQHPVDAAVDRLAMRRTGGGSIVNLTSMSAIVATGATVPSAGYCAAKAGLAHLTRELAVQWGRYGVRVNAVAPGMFRTAMVDDAAEPPGFFADRLVIKRVGGARDIVGGAVPTLRRRGLRHRAAAGRKRRSDDHLTVTRRRSGRTEGTRPRPSLRGNPSRMLDSATRRSR